MAYGEYRGAKAPGEFKVMDYFGLGLAAAIGIAIATLIDLNQKADASALFQVNQWIAWGAEAIGVGRPPLYSIVLMLMGVGAGSIFFFQPVSLRGAFIQGFGALAAVMTVLPADLGRSLDAPMEMALSADTSVSARIENNVLGAPQASPQIENVVFQQSSREATGYNLNIEINFPDGLSNEVSQMIRRGTLRGKLYNSETERTYNLFRNSGAETRLDGNRLTIRTSISGTSEQVKLFARVEAAGYKITVEQFEATQGNNPKWVINMTESNTPLFLQRLNNSYWF